jgi:tetratricopeptide (TPR) repeat protein
MRAKWWHVPRGLCVAVVVVGVLAAGTAFPAGEAEEDEYDANDCRRMGRACFERREYEEALKWYDRGLALKPKDLELNLGKAGSLAGLGRFEEAEESFFYVLELRPDDWVLQSIKAYFLAVQDRVEEAVETYDRALELYEGGYPSVLGHYDVGEGRVKASISLVYVGKAEVSYELGRFEEALACYDEALKLYDGEFPDLLSYVCERKIKVLTEMGRLGEVVETYDEALASKPDDSSMHYEKGEILVELGRLEEAVESFDRAIESREGEDAFLIFDLHEAYREKIRTLKKLGRLEDAVESCEEAIKTYDDEYATLSHDPYYEEEYPGILYHPYLEKIEALKELGRSEEALATYDEALTRFGEDENLSRGKGDVLLELGRHEEAVAAYEEAFIGDRDYSYEELIEAGQNEYILKNYVEAVTYFNAAARSKPKYGLLYKVIGGVWRDLGQEEIAASYFERGEELELEIERPYIEPGEECFARGEYEKAASYFDAAFAHYPTHDYAATMKGAALTLSGKYDEALECFEPEWEYDTTEESLVWLSAATDLLVIGEAEAMLRCLERARELDPGIIDVWLYRGVAYFMLDEYARARAALEEYLTEYGYDDIFLWLYLVDRADGRSGLERLRPLLESQDGAWERDKARFLADEMDAEDLLTKAGDNKSLLCEGHCYIGYKYKFDGDAAAARRHFEEAVAAVATGAVKPYPEYGLARRELRRLDAAGE